MSRKLRGRAHFVLRWKYFWHDVSYWYKSRRFDSHIGSNRQTDAWSWGTKSIWNHQTQSRLTKLYFFDMKLWLEAVTSTAILINRSWNSSLVLIIAKFKSWIAKMTPDHLGQMIFWPSTHYSCVTLSRDRFAKSIPLVLQDQLVMWGVNFFVAWLLSYV